MMVAKKVGTGLSTKMVTGKFDERCCLGTAVTISAGQEESIVALKKAAAV